MDVLPLKFRSPPPKPPRRRHSEQLTFSAGTFPTSKKKCFDNSQNGCEIPLETENLSLSCGSLPANWSSEYSLDEKAKLMVSKEQNSATNCSISCFHNTLKLKDTIFDKSKSKLGSLISTKFKSSTNSLNSKKLEPPYINNIIKKESSECCAKNLFEMFQKDSSKISDIEVSKEKIFKLLFRSFSKDSHHKRHNSDPLPSNFDYNKLCTYLHSSASDSNKIYNSSSSWEFKENQCLIQEIKSLKEINMKLWGHLCSVQATLNNSKRSSIENSSVLLTSDVLINIYHSLKSKENAIEDRMRIILEERNKALHDFDSIIQVLAKSYEGRYKEDKSFKKEIDELLKEIELIHDPIRLLQQQRILLSYLYKSKELKLDQMLHNMTLLTSERDNLKAKVQLLEEELNQLKLSNEMQTTDNKYWESSLLSTLCQVIQQRDADITNCNTNGIVYSNCRSSNHEKLFGSEGINNCIQRLDGTCVKKISFQSSQSDVKHFSPINLKSKSDEIRYLKEEILLLNKSLEVEIEKREHAEGKCKKLERLITVLQKKLNGKNVGIPV